MNPYLPMPSTQTQSGKDGRAIAFMLLGCGAVAALFAFLFVSARMPHSANAAPPQDLTAPLDSRNSPALPWPRHISPAISQDQPAATNLSPEDLYERVAPSVVTIIVKDENREPIASGSGFFIEKKYGPQCNIRSIWPAKWEPEISDTEPNVAVRYAYVLTNYHLMRPAVFADVVFFTGEKGVVHQVEVEDPKRDLILLHVSVAGNRAEQEHLPTGIPLAPTDPRILSTVYAIGSPKGLHGSASEGTISGIRELSDGERWLQTTAAISPGSSGGPLLLPNGTLAGVTTMALKDAQSINFAIPVSTIRTFLKPREWTKYRGRHLAEGVSIQWHEDNAFSRYYGPYDDAETHAVQLLEQARQKKLLMEWEAAIALAKEANKSLPTELKYLAHFIMGESSIRACYGSLGDRRPLPTEAQNQARNRASSHGRASLLHLIEATRLQPDFPPAYKALFFHHSMFDNWSDALLAADALVKLMPRCADALSDRAICYSILNQPQSARNDLNVAIELSPNNFFYRWQFARVFLKLREYDNAIDSYNTALELAAKSDQPIIKVCSQEMRDELEIARRRAGGFR